MLEPRKLFNSPKKYNIMAKIYQFMAEGFEDVEALAPVDILRRGGQEIVMVSITGSEYVTSAHGVTLKTDALFDDVDLADADLLMLPGGLPGSTNLNAHEGLREALVKHYESGKRIAAICAAPMVFGSLGLLEGKRATCYPGCESTMTGAEYTKQLVTIDGNIITGEGPAAAFPYAYAILEIFAGKAVADQLREGMMFNHLTAK